MHVVNTGKSIDRQTTIQRLINFGHFDQSYWGISMVLYRFFGGENVVYVQNVRPPILAAHAAFGVGEIRPNRSRLQPNQPCCVEKYQKQVDWREAKNENKENMKTKSRSCARKGVHCSRIAHASEQTNETTPLFWLAISSRTRKCQTANTLSWHTHICPFN